MSRTVALLAATAVLAFAGAASAAPAISLDRVATPVPATGAPLKLKARPDFKTSSALVSGVAKTSVERRFGSDEDIAALAGFICGRDSAADYSGAAGAYGDDPHGRFVGAKLTRSF